MTVSLDPVPNGQFADRYSSKRDMAMYLDENLQAGLAPDDVPGVFEQRLRWATGALR